jgi:hypothetical protein
MSDQKQQRNSQARTEELKEILNAEDIQEKVETVKKAAQQAKEEKVEVLQESFSTLYKKATKDVEGLGPLGRIFIAIIIVIALLKLTPILDLLYYMVQVVILPMAFLVALGVISADSYNMTMGWVESSIDYCRKRRDQEEKA